MEYIAHLKVHVSAEFNGNNIFLTNNFNSDFFFIQRNNFIVNLELYRWDVTELMFLWTFLQRCSGLQTLEQDEAPKRKIKINRLALYFCLLSYCSLWISFIHSVDSTPSTNTGFSYIPINRQNDLSNYLKKKWSYA